MSLHSFRVEEINAGSAHRRQEWPSPLRQSVAGCAWLPLLVKLQFGAARSSVGAGDHVAVQLTFFI